jgi:hypothetical protein
LPKPAVLSKSSQASPLHEIASMSTQTTEQDLPLPVLHHSATQTAFSADFRQQCVELRDALDSFLSAGDSTVTLRIRLVFCVVTISDVLRCTEPKASSRVT